MEHFHYLITGLKEYELKLARDIFENVEKNFIIFVWDMG